MKSFGVKLDLQSCEKEMRPESREWLWSHSNTTVENCKLVL
jgi:hypothetical protein